MQSDSSAVMSLPKKCPSHNPFKLHSIASPLESTSPKVKIRINIILMTLWQTFTASWQLEKLDAFLYVIPYQCLRNTDTMQAILG